MIRVNITMGEFIDRLTIVINKIYHFNKSADIKNAIRELSELLSTEIVEDKIAKNSRITDYFINLRHINKILWRLEEEVRIKLNDEERLKLSDRIRDLNRERSQIKKSINIEVNDKIEETKDYGTILDEPK